MGLVRVLMVDDEGELVSALAERLSLRGFSVVPVTNARDALVRLGEARFDVVAVDLKMPVLGGLELVRAIRSRWPGVPVVVLTGHNSAEDLAAGQVLGVAAHLLKPVDIDELGSALRAAALPGEVVP